MDLTVWNVNLQRCDVSSYTFMHSNDDNNYDDDDDDDYYYYFILILHRLFCNSNSNSKNTNNLIYDLLLFLTIT